MSDVYEKVVVAGDNITISLLVWRRFKRPMPGIVEYILDSNPGLARKGPILPVGTEILMPIPSPRPVNKVKPISLWD
ncbi:tail protein X [Phyllobacterium sp. LjRoot231]|uniref:tail protein X n=1 Tax=Phyllobacterium sp. LjRoot231 TaxID=3342289 RepID=UPI003ED0E28C